MLEVTTIMMDSEGIWRSWKCLPFGRRHPERRELRRSASSEAGHKTDFEIYRYGAERQPGQSAAGFVPSVFGETTDDPCHLIDGYIDEPGSLGVPPYIHPLVRAVYGAAKDAGAEASYHTIDDLRQGWHPEKPDVLVVLTGSAVPGQVYPGVARLRKEIESYLSTMGGIRILGGPLTMERDIVTSGLFDVVATRDPASCLYDYLTGKGPSNRWRTMDEWNRWLMLGAAMVTKHRDFPQPLVAEIETYRGCVRYLKGGCSFCVEPLKGVPVCREPKDIVAECLKLHRLGVRNFRLGAQTCFISYHAHLDGTETPGPTRKRSRNCYPVLLRSGSTCSTWTMPTRRSSQPIRKSRS